MTATITIRRAIVLRELASLGCWQSKCAELLDIEPVRVHQIGRQFGIQFPRRRNMDTHLCRAVRSGYAEGLKPEQLAERVGSTPAAVRVLASKMGLTNQANGDPAKYKRPFLLPDHLRPQYREYRHLGMTIEECGINLGLIARPQIEARP